MAARTAASPGNRAGPAPTIRLRRKLPRPAGSARSAPPLRLLLQAAGVQQAGVLEDGVDDGGGVGFQSLQVAQDVEVDGAGFDAFELAAAQALQVALGALALRGSAHTDARESARQQLEKRVGHGMPVRRAQGSDSPRDQLRV